MQIMDYDALCSQATEWQHQASDLDFLGEIALSQSHLDQVLASLGRFHRRVDEEPLAFALSVAAVNWAFWRGVDEENSRSFIESFMSHSLGHCDSSAWQNVWGPAIETTICDWSKQSPRFGAYRYVGLILRHAGVPYTKIPKLAQLLNDIDRCIGWPNVPAARDAQLRDHVAAFFGSGIVGEHLASEGGLAYLRSLSADLMLLRSRSFQMPGDLPGYRPGLLSALLEHLTLGPRVPVPPSFRLPYVIFDAASGRLELVFDEGLVRRKEQIHCDQIGRRIFDTSVDLGPGGVEPTPIFSGRFPDGRSWSTKGWRYTDRDAWALFRGDGRLVTTHSHEDPVPTGSYLLGLIPTVDVLASWPDAMDDGERQLPDGTECRLWHVVISDGDDAKLPNLHVTTTTQPWIACINADELSRWSDLDAVCSQAPELEIGGWTGRNSRRFRLMLTSGIEQEDVHPSHSADGISRITLSELPIGVVAELSLIPVGFQRGPSVIQSVKVVRFPGRITIENGLWPLNEEACVRLAVSEGLRLEAQDGARIIGTGTELTAIIPPQSYWGSVSLLGNNASLGLRFPVRRCSFSFADSPTQPAVFDRGLLREMCDASSPCRTFTVSAAPGCFIDLLVRDCQGTTRTWRKGLRLGSNGRLDLAATELVDVARQESGILEIVVRCDQFEVRTGSLFVQPSPVDLDSGPWPPVVTQYLRLLQRPLDTPESLDALSDTPCIYRHAILVAMADAAFGLSAVSPTPHVTPRGYEWIVQLRDLLATPPQVPGLNAIAWKAGLLEWLETSHLPIQPLRWDTAIRSLIAEVDRKIDISGPLHRLLAAQLDPATPDGLVHGWQCYLDAGVQSSNRDGKFIQANNFFQTAARGNPPWSAIAHRLSVWTMLRAGAVLEFVDAIERLPKTQDCPGLDAHLHAVARLLAMKQTDMEAGSGGLELSSLGDDKLLASAIEGDREQWTDAARNCWLSSWLAWRWSIIMGLGGEQTSAFRTVALAHSNAVPLRARELVTEELRSGVPRPFRVGTEVE